MYNVMVFCVFFVKKWIYHAGSCSVRNYKTFRERAELSMVASNYDRDREAENILVLPRFELRVLKSGLVYGANPRNAQLIFNTHDTNLLSAGIFRRDQIWFTEKNRYGEAMLYSLGDFKTSEVRKEDNFEKNYIQGKYGAIPFLGDFQQLLNPDVSLPANEEQATRANRKQAKT